MVFRRLLVTVPFVLAGCSGNAPLQADSHASHQSGLTLGSMSRGTGAQSFAALTEFSARFHDLDVAEGQGYNLFIVPPLTAADGCISDVNAGGMGYHYSRLNNLADDEVALLDPEFLVYTPLNAPPKDGVVRRRLASFDYFIPYSKKWPAPTDPTFTRGPTTHDFSTMSDLPDVAFAASRFNGWMFHIWLWEHNPDGMFSNFNSAVPLCEGSAF